jgi:hypothetical protein
MRYLYNILDIQLEENRLLRKLRNSEENIKMYLKIIENGLDCFYWNQFRVMNPVFCKGLPIYSILEHVSQTGHSFIYKIE